MTHPLLDRLVVRAVERAATEHLGRAWTCVGFTDLNHRASHPCGIFAGTPFSVFAKLDASPAGADQFTAELNGFGLIRSRTRVATPVPIAGGLHLPGGPGAAPRVRGAHAGDAGFAGRRELWRLHVYLAVVAVDGASAFGRSCLPRLAAAVRRYA